ncbi:MAG: DEAD/DEAH box helicase [Myxococcota bacterium]
MSEAESLDEGDAPAPKFAGPTTFDDFPIGAELRATITEMGYEKPTDVQTAVIEPAIAGNDLVVQAQTGSGKTSAFGIPLVERLTGGEAGVGAPHGLVLTPTRELALQVATELRTLGSKKGIRCHAIYGGVSIGQQTAALKAGTEVVVGTPGRLLDHIRRRNLTLSELKMIVLDEADEMLSMGFWDDVTDMIKMAPDERQTMLFSATLPYQVARAAKQYLREPVRLDLSGDELTVEGIENCIYHVLRDLPKPRQLLYILETEAPTSAIIFCNTRNETEMIAKYLTQSGFVAKALTGNFKQAEREKVMARIKSGALRYMVATDVAARGIDIDDLSHVFNYSLPEFSEVYVHRVGRTGRVGKIGSAVSLVDGKGLGTLSVLEREFNIRFVEKTLPPEDEVLRRRSQRIMKELSEQASVAEVGQHLPVAQEILGAEDAAQVVAFLLKSHFGTRSTQTDRKPPIRSRNNQESSSSAAPAEGQGRRPRRRRRRRGSSERPNTERPNNEGYGDVVSAGDILATPPSPAAEGAEAVQAGPLGDNGAGGPEAEAGSTRLRVNIGFDDGFKGRSAVAKKISALAGLNDGIVREVESRRDHAILVVSKEIAELVLERVDGAQLGKKIISVAVVK